MAFEVNELRSSFQASTGLKQYQFVALNTSGLLVNPSTLGRAIGVLTSSGTTGSTRDDTFQTVQFGGIAKVLSGSSAIAINDLISAATDGRAFVGTTGSVSGIALAAGVSTSTVSEIISVLLFPLSGAVA